MRNRSKFINASDAYSIMAGNWHDLWLIKTGRAEEPDLTWQVNVQMGVTTEELNARFLEHKINHDIVDVTRDPPYSTSMEWERESGFILPLACTPDRLVLDEGQPWRLAEFKHTGGHKNIYDVADTYMPQVHHQMAITGFECVYLSAFFGNSEHDFVEIEFNADYWQRQLEIYELFWRQVVDDIPPQDTPGPLENEHRPAVKIDGMIEKDMTGDNEWANAAASFLENQDAAKAFEAAKKDLKGMITEGERRIFGHGMQVIRKGKQGRIYVEATDGN